MKLKSILSVLVLLSVSSAANAADNRSCWTDSFDTVIGNMQARLGAGQKIKIRFRETVDFSNMNGTSSTIYNQMSSEAQRKAYFPLANSQKNGPHQKGSSVMLTRRDYKFNTIPKGSYEVSSINSDGNELTLKNGIKLDIGAAAATGGDFVNNLNDAGLQISGVFKSALQCGDGEKISDEEVPQDGNWPEPEIEAPSLDAPSPEAEGPVAPPAPEPDAAPDRDELPVLKAPVIEAPNTGDETVEEENVTPEAVAPAAPAAEDATSENKDDAVKAN